LIDKPALFRALPSVDSILADPALRQLCAEAGRPVVLAAVRSLQDRYRQAIQQEDRATMELIQAGDVHAAIVAAVLQSVAVRRSSSLQPVFNLSGTVIHTNLGRARLPREAVAAMELVALEANNLEYDLDRGARGDRDSHLEAILCELTGAEAATVVNNNAAAVLLVLGTFAKGKEVLISRGELVEIGGSFRIPDVMESAGCKLREVGTTNRTHLKDFSAAINSDTGLLMQVHTSNYEIRGFTHSVAAAELAALGREHGIPFVSDLGSGTLVDLRSFGLPYETTVQDELQAGAQLVTFSGDKLLGGPQAGLIVGDAELIAAVKRNPLKRALRIDKVTMAALLQVLALYRDPARLKERLPTLADLSRGADDIEACCQRILPALVSRLSAAATLEVVACKSQIGSGALPTDLLDSFAIAIRPIAEQGRRDASLQALSLAFRRLPKPVVGRVHDGALYLDLRCLRDEAGFVAQLEELET
jgi:L-seryl-tRNA(Ser) seleniumtransferase